MNGPAGIALVLALLALLMAGVRALQVRGRIGAEPARKLVHAGMGTICLGFPWIFAGPGPVWLLALFAGAGLLAVRRLGPLRERLGGVLGGVGRVSLGEFYFPFAVALVFDLAGEDAAAYLAPVAILTYADAAGALVGGRWGRIRYPAVESVKTLEGSLAVCVVTWLCVAVVLFLFAGATVPRALQVGVIMGLFAAFVEAVSWRGLDNLLLPVVAFAQVRIYGELDAGELAGRLLAMLLLVGLMLGWRRRLLDFSARLGAGLVLYLFWSLGGLAWLVAPLVLLVSYSRLMPAGPEGIDRHNLAAVVCIASVGVFWVVAHAHEPDPGWRWIFTLGIAGHHAIIATVRCAQRRPEWERWRCGLAGLAQALVLQTLAYVLVAPDERAPVRAILLGAVAVAAASAGFVAWERRLALPEDLNARWWRQGSAAFAGSAAALAVITL